MSETQKQTEAAGSQHALVRPWDRTLVGNVIANCRQQIEKLRMSMPANVAFALSRADRELADAQAWVSLLPPNAQRSATPEDKQ